MKSTIDVLRKELQRIQRKDAPSHRECTLLFALDEAIMLLRDDAVILPRQPNLQMLGILGPDTLESLGKWRQLVALADKVPQPQKETPRA